MLVVMVLISVGHPRPRTDERFKMEEERALTLNGKVIPVHILDISCGGVRLRQEDAVHYALQDNQEVSLKISGLPAITSEVVRMEDDIVHLHFKELKGKPRHALIQHLYTGKYENSSILKYEFFVRRLLHRIFSDHSHLYSPPTKAK